MKKRLVVLSDLWGKSTTNWEDVYFEKLSTNFNIKYYDSCKLGNINMESLNQNHLHQQFINGGIDIAVSKLLKLEKGEISILAFSIGGTIAWKAALKGLEIQELVSLSATRLRYETEKPECEIRLIYGEYDSFRPKLEWFEKMDISLELVQNVSHDFYQNPLGFELKFR